MVPAAMSPSLCIRLEAMIEMTAPAPLEMEISIKRKTQRSIQSQKVSFLPFSFTTWIRMVYLPKATAVKDCLAE